MNGILKRGSTGQIDKMNGQSELAALGGGESGFLGCIAEKNRIILVLFNINNRIFGPYLAAIHRILISVMVGELYAGGRTAPVRTQLHNFHLHALFISCTAHALTSFISCTARALLLLVVLCCSCAAARHVRATVRRPSLRCARM
jgi:hypothetical protein